MNNNNMTPQERREFEELKKTVKAIAQVMDIAFIESLKRRLGDTFASSEPSTKTAASGTQAVNEAGASTYNVMKAPTGFLTIGDKNIPYIN